MRRPWLHASLLGTAALACVLFGTTETEATRGPKTRGQRSVESASLPDVVADSSPALPPCASTPVASEPPKTEPIRDESVIPQAGDPTADLRRRYRQERNLQRREALAHELLAQQPPSEIADLLRILVTSEPDSGIRSGLAGHLIAGIVTDKEASLSLLRDWRDIEVDTKVQGVLSEITRSIDEKGALR